MDDDEDKIVKFPGVKERKAQDREKQRLQKQQEQLEEEYRRLYRAEQSTGKQPFINWGKIPPFTRVIIGLLLVLQLLFAFVADDAQKLSLVYTFGFVPAVFSGGLPWHFTALVSPITSLFLHGGWMHLTFNLVMVMAMGVFCERFYGAKKTAIIFILCGLCANLACFVINPGSVAPVIGASGAISGLFAVAFLTMIDRGMTGSHISRRGSLSFILLWITLIVLMGMIFQGTSWQSHLGGFLGGIALFQLGKKGIIRLF